VTQRIVPMIAYADAAAAIDWLTEAFGFRERAGQRFTDEHGTVVHAELERDGAIVMLATPNPEYEGPRRHRETREAARRWQDNPWVIDGLLVEVDDVDAPPRAGRLRGRDRDPAARGRRRRRHAPLHRRGPRRPPLDVRPATRTAGGMSATLDP
jgi:glyoxalase/bleomycin resistance protein/dioxygenase superfamily protein